MTMQLPFKLAIGFGCLFMFGIIFGFVAFPKILKSQIAAQVALKPGAEMRAMWSKVPFPIDFRVYMFNVTNPDAVHNGAIPEVQEIGPYFYEEWKEKVNMEDDPVDDTVSYDQKTTWIFDQSKSGRLTGDEMITIPHPFILGLGLSIAREKPAMLSLINKAIKGVHENPPHMFLTAPAKEILFEGFTIKCDKPDFPSKALCAGLKSEVKGLVIVNETTYKFSFFGPKNGTIDGRFKVKRGITNVAELGKVVEFNGMKIQSVWSGKECNMFKGTDSTIFPPFLTYKDDLVSYAPDLCLSLGAIYQKPSSYAGVPTNRYTATFGDMSTDKSMACYCPTPTTCMKKGTIDLTKCTGGPLIASLPHFFEADPSFLTGVKGLNPNRDDHEIFIEFESITGSPVAARKRLQFNIPLEKVAKIDVLKNLPETTLPMFWVEEGISLNSTFTDKIKHDLFRTLKIVDVVKWLMVVVGILGAIGSGVLYYMKKTGFAVTPAPTTKSNGHAMGEVGDNPQKSHVISTVSNGNLEKF